MAFITAPQILQVRNAANQIVVANARSLQFIGGIVVTDGGGNSAVIDGTGGSGNVWDTLGNAGAGLKLGTNDASAWELIVDGITRASFDALGVFSIGDKQIIPLSVDPTAGAGVAANVGSIGLFDNAGVGALYLKSGAADTAWQLLASALPSWLTNGNTGAGLRIGTTSNDLWNLIANNVNLLSISPTGTIFMPSLSGIGTARQYRRVNSVDVPAGTTQNLFTIPIIDNHSGQMVLTCSALDVNNPTTAAQFKCRLGFNRVGGVYTFQQFQTEFASGFFNDGSPNFVYQFNPVGAQIFIQVSHSNPALATRWVGDLEWQTVGI